MSVNDLLHALAMNGTRILLDEVGTGICLRGGRSVPDLLAEVKAHKPELVAALQEARALAVELIRTGEAEAFAAEMAAARKAGTVSVIDWCASDLAVKLARRWTAANPTPTPERTTPCEPEREAGKDHQTLAQLVEALDSAKVALLVMPDDSLHFAGGEPPDALWAQVVAATNTVLAAATLSARLDHGEALCEAATGPERDRLEAHWAQLERAYEDVLCVPLGTSGTIAKSGSHYRRAEPVTLVPIWSAACPTIRRDPEARRIWGQYDDTSML